MHNSFFNGQIWYFCGQIWNNLTDKYGSFDRQIW